MFDHSDASQFHQPFLPNNNVQADNNCSSKPDSTEQHEHNTCKSPCPEPGINAKDPFIIEFCAGSARVTACLQQLGLSASFGVDHLKQKNAGRVLIADLTTKAGRDLCWTWLKSPNCVGMFAAPPCGTCSRARGIPIKLPNGFLIAGPQPLRTDDQPNGVSQMSYINRMRVSHANSITSSPQPRNFALTMVCSFALKIQDCHSIGKRHSSARWPAV